MYSVRASFAVETKYLEITLVKNSLEETIYATEMYAALLKNLRRKTKKMFSARQFTLKLLQSLEFKKKNGLEFPNNFIKLEAKTKFIGAESVHTLTYNTASD